MATITTTHKMEVPDTDITFELDCSPPESHEEVWTRQTTDEDGTLTGYEVSWLVRDEGQMDYEWDDPKTPSSNWVNGCFRDFRNSRDGGGEEARDDFLAKMVGLVGDDRVFIVDVYSHGLDHFSVSESRFYPDREWDVAPACVIAVPSDVTNPKEWANGVLETYSSWCNGDVWIVVTYAVTLDGAVTYDEYVGNFIGREYAEETARTGY